jgi:peptidoglycan hydrolase-like protein with peptidoglycan-binding domain
MRSLLQQAVSRKIVAALAVGSLVLPAAVFAKQQGVPKTSVKSTKSTSSSKSVASSKSTSSAKKSTKAKTSKNKTKKVRGQTAPTPERINEIQSALARNGAFSGDPTGKWDDSTAEGMKRFQAAHGLAPTGKFDALTLQKLGLGAETAGHGAPTPPPNAAANRLLSQKVQREEAKNEPETNP